MNSTSFYPVVMSRDVAATADFYRRMLDFTDTYVSDWYVSLRRDASELAVLQADHPSVPIGWRSPAAGLLLNLEVEDVDTVHQRLVEDGARVVQELRDEDFGQRHVIIEGPDGVLLDVIQPIPPRGEFIDNFAPGAAVSQ